MKISLNNKNQLYNLIKGDMKKLILILTVFILSVFILAGFLRADPPPAQPVSVPTIASVTVPEYISMTLLNVPIDFGIMNPGEINKYDVGYTGPLTVHIGEETNVNVGILTRANDTMFRSEMNSFLVSNMKWSINSNFIPAHDYQTFDNLVTIGTSGNDYPIYHRLAIPLAQQEGTYSVGITITGIQAP